MDSSDSYSVDDSRPLIAGVEVMVSFLFIITIVTLVTYLIGLCRAHRLPGVLPYHRQPPAPASPVGPGLDEAALRAFPKILYSNKAPIVSITTCRSNDSKIGGNNVDHHYTTSMSCSVCLADYDESDVLRVLPDCGHVFHLDCVDSWLRLNPTCPMCRKLPKVPSASPDSCKIMVQV